MKCLEGPAKTVKPEESPPSIEPESAAFTMGTGVVVCSFSPKNCESARTEAPAIFDDFFNLSNSDICYIIYYFELLSMKNSSNVVVLFTYSIVLFVLFCLMKSVCIVSQPPSRYFSTLAAIS